MPPPDIQEALAVLMGGGGGSRPGRSPFAPQGIPPQRTIPLKQEESVRTGVGPQAPGAADPEMVKLFTAALEQGADAVGKFLDQYGPELDAATWSEIASLIQQGPDELPGVIKAISKISTFGLAPDSTDPEWDRKKLAVQQNAFRSGVFILDEATRWENLPDAIIQQLQETPETEALGEDVENLEKIAADKVAEGANAAEIPDPNKSAKGKLTEWLATATPEKWLDLNPHLAGMTEIPAGTPVFFQPRSVALGQGQTVADLFRERGISPEAGIAYNQNLATQFQKTFDPDNLALGQRIFIPPQAFLDQFGEQTQPPGTVPWQPGVGPQGPEPVVSGTTAVTGDPYLDQLYQSGGVDALFADLIGSKKYSAPYSQYLQSKLPQVLSAFDMQRLMTPNADEGPVPDALAALITGLEGGQTPDIQQLISQMYGSPEYRSYEADLGLSGVAQLLESLRGNTITQTDANLYSNPDYMALKIAEYTRLYGAGGANAPTFFEYLVRSGM